MHFFGNDLPCNKVFDSMLGKTFGRVCRIGIQDLVSQLEERGSREYFGEAYDQYVVVTPDFIP